MGKLVTDGLVGWARYAPDQLAIVFDGTDKVTYQQLNAWTDNAAHHLQGLGVSRGDRVGIVGKNSLEWVAAAVGALKVGAIVVPLNERSVAEELRHLVEVSGTSLILGDEGRWAEASATADLTSVPLHALADFTALRSAAHQPFEVPEVDSSSAAILIFTSGTSSLPKAAVYTHDGFHSMVYEYALMNPVLRAGARWLYVLGMSGAPGLPWHILHSLTRGSTLYYETGFDPKTTLERLRDEKIEMMVGVPMLFEAMMARPEFEGADLSALALTSIAGARCDPGVLQKWLDKGVVLRQAYGMTEVFGTYTLNEVAEAFTKPEYCGRGSLFSKHRVVRSDGTDCEPGEPGEIVISSPMLIKGYWENESATREAFRDGWFYTGDVGVLDETGSVRIVDRVKDIIISGGYNIAPAEIENAMTGIAGVTEVCVVGSRDEKYGETPTAVVFGEPGLTAEQLALGLKDRIASYKYPKHYVIRDEPLPRMASGKIARRKVRELLEGQA